MRALDCSVERESRARLEKNECQVGLNRLRVLAGVDCSLCYWLRCRTGACRWADEGGGHGDERAPARGEGAPGGELRHCQARARHPHGQVHGKQTDTKRLPALQRAQGDDQGMLGYITMLKGMNTCTHR